VILEAVTFTEEPEPSAFSAEGTDIAGDAQLEVEWGAPLAPGTRLVRAYYTPTSPNARIHIDSRMPVQVTFGAAHYRSSSMRRVVADIRALLGAFDPFLPA
jgi:hypothetical protein